MKPTNMKTFVHIPRSLTRGGTLRPMYKGLDDILKNVLFDLAGHDHVARFGCRLASAGLWTGQPLPIPAPRPRGLSSPVAPLSCAAHHVRTQSPAAHSPVHRACARSVARGEDVPAGVGASHPALRAGVVSPRVAQNHMSQPGCVVCAVSRGFSFARNTGLPGHSMDAAGKIAAGSLDHAHCPFLFEELGLNVLDEHAIVQTAKAFSDDALYGAFVAMGLCAFHTCRIVQAVIADRTLGHEITTFRSHES